MMFGFDANFKKGELYEMRLAKSTDSRPPTKNVDCQIASLAAFPNVLDAHIGGDSGFQGPMLNS